MASPTANAWMAAPAAQQLPGAISASEAEEMGLQVRTMGLKVHYTFDKDSRVNCLARWPQTLQVQAVPLSDVSWIGLIDLRTCLQAIAQCSPEIMSQIEHDYAVYAYDYSEPDTPLVGQGMLSGALDMAPLHEGSKMVTGRVSKNTLAIFGNGVRETLEVKLKLTEVPRPVRSEAAGHGDASSQPRNAPTPTDTTEWNSFLQSNPALGRSANISAVQSPGLAPVRPDMSHFHQQRPPSAASRPASRPGSRQSPMPPSLALAPRPPLYPLQAASRPNGHGHGMAAGSPPPTAAMVDEPVVASMPPVEPAKIRSDAACRPARPSSRTRSKVPTGRPRGRPRKQPTADGNTSAAEEQPTDADADDSSKRKRVKTTKADYPTKTSLDMPPNSLRVAASTSGSLRTLRPIMAAPMPGAEGSGNNSINNSSNGGPGSHLQELPRAPTPVPQGAPPSQHHVRKMLAEKSRRGSMVEVENTAFQDQENPFSHSVDARSPTDSLTQSPENYTPEDSPAEIGSSPPVPRSTTYIPQSSPMPSSPILPPMPRQPQADSGFMSGGMDDMFDDDDCLTEMGLQPPAHTPKEFAAQTPSAAAEPQSRPAVRTTTGSFVDMNAAPPAINNNTINNQQQHQQRQQQQLPQLPPPPTREGSSRPVEQYSFKAMNPGPPELLPVTSIYDPPPPPKARPSRSQKAASVGAKTLPATLKRSYSEPAQPPQQQQQEQGQLTQPSGVDHAADAPPTTATEAVSATPTAPAAVADSLGAGVGDGEELAELAMLIAAEDDLETAVLAEMETDSFNASTSRSDLQIAQLQLPSSMPQHLVAETFAQAASHRSSKPSSAGLAVPASDPPAPLPLALPAMPPAPTAFSEAPCPPSDTDQPRSNKNLVRKAAIRERLQKAIESGEMPPFCQNCGAIETPTWRKMWTQDHDGEPGYHEYSEKPGHVTAIDILKRDGDGKPTRHRLVKKALGPTESTKQWTQMLLCNPCGIWLGKFKSHRPSDRWDRDASRLNQTKRKRDPKSGGGGSRSRKPRTKSDTQLQPTSEAYFTTDPVDPTGPAELDDVSVHGMPMQPSRYAALSATAEPGSTDDFPAGFSAATAAINHSTLSADPRRAEAEVQARQQQPDFEAGSNRGPASGGSGGGGGGGGSCGGSASRPGLRSAHSRGSGTAKSPIAVDDHNYGATRRLLFPSPRKDGMPKVLGELDANSVASASQSAAAGSKSGNGERERERERENGGVGSSGECVSARQAKGKTPNGQDEMVDLFGTPPPVTRPSTPPPRSSVAGDGSFATASSSGPFKTPTRPTPSHRPMTRSITKSIRSVVHCPMSPSESQSLMALQRTPSKTPRSVPPPSSGGRRAAGNTPGRQSMHGSFQMCDMTFDMPFTSTLNQLLSEANDFTTGSPSHGLGELDLASLGSLDGDGMGGDLHNSANYMDFVSYLDTDMVMPSSSALLGRKSDGGHNSNSNSNSNNSRHHQQATFGGALTMDSDALWTDFPEDVMEEDE